MATQINSNSSGWTNKIYPLFGETKPAQSATDEKIRAAGVMNKIVTEEEAIAKKALADSGQRYPISIVGGGALNVGVLALTGVSAFVASPILATILGGLGILGGLFNLKEGALAIEEGIKAWKSNDKKLALRLILQGVLECALGVAMLVLSIAQLAAITSITAVFAANPYILPALFFCLAIFLLVETMHRLGPVIKGTDLGSKLELPHLRQILRQKDPELRMQAANRWVHSQIGDCIKADPAKQEELIQKKINYYKSEIGFPAAMEAFHLFDMILKNEKKHKILEQITQLENKISSWNKTLYLKVFSVVLAAGGFGAGMGALALRSESIDGIQNLAMCAAGAVPLYLDVCKPFEREIPIVIHRKSEKAANSDLEDNSSSGQKAVRGPNRVGNSELELMAMRG